MVAVAQRAGWLSSVAELATVSMRHWSPQAMLPREARDFEYMIEEFEQWHWSYP